RRARHGAAARAPHPRLGSAEEAVTARRALVDEALGALLDVEQVLGHLVEEARLHLLLPAAGDAPATAAGEQQPLLGAGHADVEESALLFKVLERSLRVEVRQH